MPVSASRRKRHAILSARSSASIPSAMVPSSVSDAPNISTPASIPAEPQDHNGNVKARLFLRDELVAVDFAGEGLCDAEGNTQHLQQDEFEEQDGDKDPVHRIDEMRAH